MSAVPNDLVPQDPPVAGPQNVVEEAMSWEYGLGQETIALPTDDLPAAP